MRYHVNGTQPDWFLGSGVTNYPTSVPNNKDVWSDPWTNTSHNGYNVGANITYNITKQLTLRTAFLYAHMMASAIYQRNFISAGNTYTKTYYDFPDAVATGGGEYALLDWRFDTWKLHHKAVGGFVGSASQDNAPVDTYAYSTNTISGSLSSPYYTPFNTVTWKNDLGATIPAGGTPAGTQAQYTEERYNVRNYLLSDTIDFTHGVTLLMGINAVDVDENDYNTPPYTASNPPLADRYDKNKPTPTVALMYKPIPKLLIYSGYMESLEEGAQVGDGFTNANQILEPLTSKQYEVGAKTELGKALATLDYFHIDKASQYSITLPGNTLPTEVQSGRQYNQGVEFTISGKVTNDITLFGGATYVSPVINNTSTPAYNGKDAIGVARASFKMYGEYQMPFAPKWTATGGVYYTGQVYENSLNTNTVAAHTTVDLGSRYTTNVHDLPLIFRVNITNLTNKAYWLDSPFQGQAFIGAPITARASATIRF
jgi:iron complex outermembrane receptor protein